MARSPDVARFSIAIDRGQLLDEASKALAWTPPQAPDGDAVAVRATLVRPADARDAGDLALWSRARIVVAHREAPCPARDVRDSRELRRVEPMARFGRQGGCDGLTAGDTVPELVPRERGPAMSGRCAFKRGLPATLCNRCGIGREAGRTPC